MTARRRKKDGCRGTGDVGIDGVGAAVSGERATEVLAVEEAVWDRLREEGGKATITLRI